MSSLVNLGALSSLNGFAAGAGAAASTLAALLFPNGEAGAMYDPSQLDTMYQAVNAELSAVAADGDPVGVLLDIRLWDGKTFDQVMAAQPELITGLSAADVTAGGNNLVTDEADGSVKVAYVDNFTGWTLSNINTIANDTVLEAGKTYAVSFEAKIGTTSTVVRINNGSINIDTTVSSTSYVSYTLLVRGAGGTPYLQTRNFTAGKSLFIRNFSMKVIPGNHATQTIAASRPTYKTALGLHWIEGDGVADWIRATFAITQPWERVSAIRQVTWTVADQIFGGVTANAGVLYAITSSPNIAIFDGVSLDATDELLNQDQTIYEKHNGANSAIAIDGNTEQTGNAGTDLPGGVSIFCNNSNSRISNTRLYFMVMRAGTMTTEQRAVAEDAAATRIGA